MGEREDVVVLARNSPHRIASKPNKEKAPSREKGVAMGQRTLFLLLMSSCTHPPDQPGVPHDHTAQDDPQHIRPETRFQSIGQHQVS